MAVVVIPVAASPRNDTLALAIASIHHHTDYQVATIGHDLGLADQHLPMAQGHDVFVNTNNAMRLACETFEHFIWSADDIYWLDDAQPVMWAIGKLETRAERGIYTRRKLATRDRLVMMDLPTWDYEAHVPMPIRSDVMLEALDIVATRPLLDKRSLYGNMLGDPDVIAPDVKVRTAHQSLPDGPWLSSHEAVQRHAIAAHVTARMEGA